MSWQEKIERYQAQLQKKEKSESQKELEWAKEMLRARVGVLEGFNCRELLTQIKNEI